jgi:hypothetical protein
VLQSLSVSITAAGAAPSGSGELIGQIQFSGKAVGTTDVASLVARLENVKGWVNGFVGSLAQEAGGADYSFQGTVDLSRAVLTKRGAAGAAVAVGG